MLFVAQDLWRRFVLDLDYLELRSSPPLPFWPPRASLDLLEGGLGRPFLRGSTSSADFERVSLWK